MVAMLQDVMLGWERLSPQKKLAIRIRMARVAADMGKGITQEELGRRVGEALNQPPFSQNQVYLWESSGNAPSYALGAIAKATGIRIDFFSVV